MSPCITLLKPLSRLHAFALVGVTGCGGSVPAPNAFVPYNSPTGRFSCDYPKGWEADGGGKARLTHVVGEVHFGQRRDPRRR